MRVAALNDIHGNLPALDAVLAEVEQEGVDTIICGGDVVAGPFPVEVYDRLPSLPDVRFLRGNVDRLVAEGVGEYGHDWIADRRSFGSRRRSSPSSSRGRSPSRSTSTVSVEHSSAMRCRAADEPIFTRVDAGRRCRRAPGRGRRRAPRLRPHPRPVRQAAAERPAGGQRGKRGDAVRRAARCLLGAPRAVRSSSGTPSTTSSRPSPRMRDVEPVPEELIGWLRDPPDPDEVSRLFEDRRSAPSGT